MTHPTPPERDGQGWHDLAEQRAATEGIPFGQRFAEELTTLSVPVLSPGKLAEVQAILGRHGITKASVEEQIDAEQAGIAAGTVVPLRPRK